VGGELAPPFFNRPPTVSFRHGFVFPVSFSQDDLHFLTVCRYVEANPLRSKRVEKGELKPLQESVNRGRPFGDARWVAQTAARLGLGNTLREPGRPAKPPGKRQGKRETSSDPLSSSGESVEWLSV
jgi:hypothetical protein